MSTPEHEHYSKDELIAELINRQTFAGLVIFHRGDAKGGRLEAGEVVITKSPPLTREGVEELLRAGASMVPAMFGEQAATGPLPLDADFQSVRPALRVDELGVARIGNSRVSLDLVVEQYRDGMTPEEIVRSYDTLALADVYGAIAWYLAHPEQAERYLVRRRAEADSQRKEIEALRPRVTLDELLRRQARENVNAPAGQ